MSPSAALRRELAKSPRLLLALDFDGTLARLRRDRRAPRLPAGRRKALSVLAKTHGVRILVVSGRALADLRGRCPVPGAAFAGDHGLRLEGIGPRWRHPDLARRRRRAGILAAAARAAAKDLPGVRVERKEASVAVHYRNAPAVRRDPKPLKRALERLPLSGWRVAPGKCLWELRPRQDWGKGEAILLALKRLGRGWKAAFVGDDTTDEEGFAVLGRRALTVRVGPGRTAARWRLPGIGSVDRLLAEIRRSRRP
ncbi:MAG: trehalose-phosphatase [Elusimicrobia bacterium]|nr:trehalose-phosphatase [Elusimicrobiota bacterium]